MAEEIIAVMGATGSGKSSLIKLITENEKVAIGHGLVSETQAISAYTWDFGGRNITLVDTPGFDDTYRSDGDILQSLVEWLTTTYRGGKKLSGIIYLHRITDVRMQGSSMRNLRVFRELCGREFFSHVALCASFWDAGMEKKETLELRFNELVDNQSFWGSMAAAGSTIFRDPLTRPNAIRLIFTLLDGQQGVLQVQREIVDEKKSIQESSAVSQLMSLELERQEQEHSASMAEMKRQFEHEIRVRDRTHSENLEGMRKAYEERLAQTEALNAKVRAEIGIISNNQQAPPPPRIARKSLPPNFNRASTMPTGALSINQEIVKRRAQRYNSFAQYMDATIQLLENERRSGRVKCNFLPQKSSYLMVCTNCLQNIGSGYCYKCVDCSVANDFLLCVQCFNDNNIHCDKAEHRKADMLQGMANLTGIQCPRVRYPPQSGTLLCRKCNQNVGRCYLHCCACSEQFDMCIRCATQGKHCPGHRKAFSPHRLEICARYVDV